MRSRQHLVALGDNHRINGDFEVRRWPNFSLAVSAAVMVRPQVATAETLYVSSNFDPTFSDGRIERVIAEGGVRQVVREVGGGLRGIAVDVSSNSLFWTDVDTIALNAST